MPGFDYGNVRLRCMKSRLLTRVELGELAGSENVHALIAGLTRTAYRRPVEVALARTSGLPVIAEAIRAELLRTLAGARSFYSGQPGDMVALAFRRIDLHNLKAVMRGVVKRAPPGEIEACLLPVGALDARALSDLARTPDPRTMIDRLASMRSEFAHPLMRLRVDVPGAIPPQMEQALEAWYFRETCEAIDRFPHGRRHLRAALSLEADITNLLTVLRFVQSPAERQRLRSWPGSPDISSLFVASGKIPPALLDESAGQSSVEAAVARLEKTPYRSPLSEGLAAFAKHSLLSGFEKALRVFQLRWLAKLVHQDPLGIGVPLGFMALKENEVSNLRWIAHGVQLKLGAAAIRHELEFAV